jgi:thiol-disulfide isomerase/thioredoxin
MQTVHTRAEYDSALLQCKAHYGLVVVDFFAPWCAGCRCMYPKLRQIAAANLDVAFIKVNTETEEMRHLSQELGVTGLPYFNLHAGHKVQAFAANLSKVGRLRTEISALKDAITAQAEAVAAQPGSAMQGVV